MISLQKRRKPENKNVFFSLAGACGCGLEGRRMPCHFQDAVFCSVNVVPSH